MTPLPSLRRDQLAGPDTRMRWPSRFAVLRPGRHGSLREHVKYGLRRLLGAPFQGPFLDLVGADPALRALFSARPTMFHAPLSRFLDRRFSIGERFHAAATDLACASRALGGARLRQFVELGPQVLGEPLPGVRLCLGLNDVTEQEGYWALSLRDEDGLRLYHLSFAFLDPATILLASLQGPSPRRLDAGQAVRDMTRAAHGLRPANLLVEALRLACGAWGVTAIEAIDPSHHAKERWNRRGKRLKFDYCGLWRELGAEQEPGGRWRLPLAARRKSMAEIPSRKRGMYRQRFEMLDRLAAGIAQALGDARRRPAG